MIFSSNRIAALLIFCWLGLLSCQQVSPLAVIEKPTDQKLLIYDDSPAFTGALADGIDCAVLLVANGQTGGCQLTVRIRNLSKQNLDIPYQQWQLSTPDGLRSSAAYTEAYPNTIAVGETQTYVLDYRPTNSRAMSMMLEQPGDLKQEYRLMLDPWNTEIAFALNEKDYEAYLASYGVEKNIVLYMPEALTEWMQKQESHVKQVFPTKNIFVNMRENEWNIQGVVMKIIAYSLNDSMHIGYRIANQATPHLRVLPESFELLVNGKSIAGRSITMISSNKPALDGKGLAVLKSERFQANYVYPMGGNMLEERVELGVALKWYDENKPVLHASIHLKLASNKI